MTLQFKRAVRAAVKLKIGIDGPSGSGKTEGALAIATGITNGGKIAVADTENESASYYADRYTFDSLNLPQDVDAKMMREVIRLAIREKYDALVLDSHSRVWLNILDAKDKYDLSHPKANKWTTWGRDEFGPAWNDLMKDILAAPIPIIATMRSKQAHEQITKSDGSKEVVKLGLQPQVREGSEYEFGLVLSLDMQHRAQATKDRTHLFPAGKEVDLCDPELHKALVRWMNTETPATDEQKAQLAALAENPALSDDARAKLTEALAGISADKAAKWIAQLTARIAAAPAQTALDMPATGPAAA
jgi:hypothetical protein